LRRVAACTADDGFTLIEVIVAMMLIGIVMAATTTFFISSANITSQLRGQQVAAQIADSTAEQVRAYRGSEIATALPAVTPTVVNGVTYTPSLTKTPVTISGASYERVNISVSWPDKHCASSICSYLTYILISGAADPMFNTN
jgi:prepilin-type N-terminal cleavage/methylation domain-containing protein